MFNNKAKAILENYGSIKTVSRLFYPRNFNLSPEFVVAFKREYSRLKSLSISDKQIIQKIAEALHFHGREAASENPTNQ